MHAVNTVPFQALEAQLTMSVGVHAWRKARESMDQC